MEDRAFKMYNMFVLEEATLDEIYDRFYSSVVTKDIFDKLVSIDPTSRPNKKGKYLDWLIRKAYASNNKILEDASKVKGDLELFDKYGTKLKKQIGDFKDQYDLSKAVSEIRNQQNSLKSNKEVATEIKKGATKIFDDGKWLVVVPETKEASCYYGKGTRWCTAADNDNMFDEYNKDGKLYIIINKDTDEKYQFHFESLSFMNSSDEPIKEWPVGFTGELNSKLLDLVKDTENRLAFAYMFVKIKRVFETGNIDEFIFLLTSGDLYGHTMNWDRVEMVKNSTVFGNDGNYTFEIAIAQGLDRIYDIAVKLGTRDDDYSEIDNKEYVMDNYGSASVFEILDYIKGYKNDTDIFADNDAYDKFYDWAELHLDSHEQNILADKLKKIFMEAQYIEIRKELVKRLDKCGLNDYRFFIQCPASERYDKFVLKLDVDRLTYLEFFSDKYYGDKLMNFGWSYSSVHTYANDENFRKGLKSIVAMFQNGEV